MESGDAGSTSVEREEGLRKHAVERIERKQKFLRDLVLYLLVNAGLWAFWAYEGANTNDLWPAVVSGIWGVFLAHDAFRAYGEGPISEQQIEEEMRRIKPGYSGPRR